MLRIIRIFLVILQVAKSVYEEQYGEFNWQLENIGFIDDVVYNVSYLTVDTTRRYIMLLFIFSAGKLMLEQVMVLSLVLILEPVESIGG